jgi:uncharacterized lipoprotein YddW (UPF0748 family)
MNKLLLLFLIALFPVASAFSQPDRELRSVWLTSVYNIDWPHSTTVSAENQKLRLISILNSLQEANFNAVMFQVRPNADALYQSKYEPWSSWITGTRGQVPSYDPLAFVIQEANKRGMEVHAWLNPYRFENTSGQWSGQPGDYTQTHPELIINYNGKTYFDPGLPATTQLIKKVVADLISNYDLDGILFDDYFYPSNMPLSYDQETFNTYGTKEFVSHWYTVTGTLPSRGDFRRASVNNMIREVNDTIKALRPAMVFGVSPAGIYSTQASAATHWGTTLPSGISGNDNYNAINCDPLAWLRDQSVDYISPQLYWAIGGSQDFITLTQWWGKEAKRRGRHNYPSLGSYRLFAQKNGEFFSNETKELVKKEAGPNTTKDASTEKFNWPLSEIGDQIIANRNNPHNLAQGIIFYNTRSTVNTQKNLSTYLAADLYSQKTIFPVMDWLPPTQEGAPKIAEIGVVGDSAGGTIAMNIIQSPAQRFLLYGWDQLPTKDLNAEPEFMQVIFGKDFAEFYHKDRNVFSIQEFFSNRELGNPSAGVSYEYLVPASIVSPNNETVCDNFQFTWGLVPESQQYQLQLANSKDPGKLVFTSPFLTTNSFTLPEGILAGKESYIYRIKAMANLSVSWSAEGTFIAGQPRATVINSPTNGALNTNLTMNFQWSSVPEISHYHVQIATDASFAEEYIVVDQQPVNFNLFSTTLSSYNQKHYTRVRAINTCGAAMWSPVINFTTTSGTAVDNTVLSVLKVFPNPVTESCSITYPYPLAERSIQLLDANGRLLAEYYRNENTLTEELDLSGFTQGFYFIRIETPSGQRFMSRLVKL